MCWLHGRLVAPYYFCWSISPINRNYQIFFHASQVAPPNFNRHCFYCGTVLLWVECKRSGFRAVNMARKHSKRDSLLRWVYGSHRRGKKGDNGYSGDLCRDSCQLPTNQHLRGGCKNLDKLPQREWHAYGSFNQPKNRRRIIHMDHQQTCRSTGSHCPQHHAPR